MPPGHHRFDATAVLCVVKCSPRDERSHQRALGWLRPRVPRGLRALTAPPRSAHGGVYVMAGLIPAADTLLRVKDVTYAFKSLSITRAHSPQSGGPRRPLRAD